MKVSELIEKLQAEDPAAIVTVTRGVEPNSFIVLEVTEITEDVMVYGSGSRDGEMQPSVRLLTHGQR